MFSAAELADLRATQEEWMPDTCTVVIPGDEVDDDAGGTTAGAETETEVACRVGSPNANDQKVADRLSIVFDAAITLPYGTAIDERGRIEVERTGLSYQIVYTNEEQTDATAVRVLAKRRA